MDEVARAIAEEPPALDGGQPGRRDGIWDRDRAQRSSRRVVAGDLAVRGIQNEDFLGQ